MKPRNSNNFKQLKDEWYKKLADSGFKDIEQDEYHLKSWSYKFGRPDQSEQQRDAKFVYYNLAESFLNTHKFTRVLDKTIWEYHVNGVSARDISIILKKSDVKMSKSGVWKIINRLRDRLFHENGLKNDTYDY